MPDEPFDLFAVIRQKLDNATTYDAGHITSAVITSVPERDRYEALRQAVRRLVAAEASAVRNRLMRAAHKNDDTEPGHSAPDAQRPDAQPGVVNLFAAGGDMLREAGERLAWLAAWQSTPNGTKRVRDLTADECDFCADERAGQAAALATRSEQFRNLAKYLRHTNTPTVGELPVEILREAF